MSGITEKNVDLDWLAFSPLSPNAGMRREAEQRQARLTKPPGALGQLESVAIELAALQGTVTPQVDRVHVTVFAGDHGVAVEGVSAFPQAVTAEMVKNFSRGGAAICVVARSLGLSLEIINLGTAYETGLPGNVMEYSLGPGTANFVHEPAMGANQLAQALDAGRSAVERAQRSGSQLFIGGEMGIGNTTSASALACALLRQEPKQLVGPGTGLDVAGIARKSEVIQRALALHGEHAGSPLELLRRLGGFEIAAMAGAYVTAAQVGVPVLVDGFISSVSALVAEHLCPGARRWFLFSHASAEPGHRLVREALDARPLLDLGMRLGEGSGAAVAVPLLRMACVLHNEMATFAEAGVSEKRG